jgi:Transposase DDE domain group 1
LWLPTFPLKASPASPKNALQLPHSTRSFTVRAEKWKTASKEAQQDLFADRTSTGWMASNQLRLWFSAFAHLMLSVLRAEVLRGTDLAKATLGQIRLKLFKIGARIKISCRRIHLELASAYPLPGNLPARLYKPLRNAGELNFKEALVDTRKRTGFQPTQDPVPNFPHQGQKDPRSPLCDSDQAG